MRMKSPAFSGFSVFSVDEAKKFYGETLGLDASLNEMGILELQLATGGVVILYPKDNHEPASYTVLNFPVDDIDEVVKSSGPPRGDDRDGHGARHGGRELTVESGFRAVSIDRREENLARAA